MRQVVVILYCTRIDTVVEDRAPQADFRSIHYVDKLPPFYTIKSNLRDLLKLSQKETLEVSLFFHVVPPGWYMVKTEQRLSYLDHPVQL